MKKSKKILIAIVAIVVVVVGLALFWSLSKPSETKQTDILSLDAIVVDDSYRDEDDSPERVVYAFFTMKQESNIKFSSKYVDLIVDGTNTYTSEVHAQSLCKYAPNYYYGVYNEEGYLGETKKMVATFLIPEGDLVNGKEIRFSYDSIEDMDELSVFTDSIIHVNSDKEACKIVDPEGCAEREKAYADAPTERVKEVKSLINGYYVEAYGGNIKYKVTFSAPNSFVLETTSVKSEKTLVKNGGSYSVKNGFISCTYDDSGKTFDIPYELKDGDIEIHLVEALGTN